MARSLLACSFVFLACIALASCAYTLPFRDRAGQVVPGSIARFETLNVNGTRQSLLVRGRDRKAPVVLILHGGPGSSETPLFRLYDPQLEDHFVVAYWDQRGAGRSYASDIPASSMTIDQLVRDLGVVIGHLRTEFTGRKLVLLGHSWGSALGLIYAARHPDDVLAFVGVGQVASFPLGEMASYQFALREARRRGNDQAILQLSAIGPPPHSTDAMLVSRRWVERFGGTSVEAPNKMNVALSALALPEFSLPDVVRLWRGADFSLHAMWPELRELDLFQAVPCVAAPVTFFLGRHDWQVPAAIAAEYFTRIQSPAKRLNWFEQAAHDIPFEAPAAFRAAFVDAVARALATPTVSASFCEDVATRISPLRQNDRLQRLESRRR